MILPMDNIGLWNAVEGEDGVYLSQLRPDHIFWPSSPPQAGVAVAICTILTWVGDPDDPVGIRTSHPLLCGSVASPDHHGALICAFHQHRLYRCQCCEVWLGDSPEHFCPRCRDERCGGMCSAETGEYPV